MDTTIAPLESGGTSTFFTPKAYMAKVISVRTLPFIGTRAMVGVVPQIRSPLHGSRRKNGTVFRPGSLWQAVDIGGKVVDDPVQPSGGPAVLVGIEQGHHITLCSRGRAAQLQGRRHISTRAA